MLNLKAKNSYHVFDEFGMLIIPGDELSWRDSVGRTVLAWIAYDRPEELKYALNDCISPGRYGANHVLFRHPNYKELSSRDHWSYFLIYMKLWGNGAWYNSFVKYIPFMRGLYLWMHALTGNKLAEWLYYLIYIPGAKLGNWWNGLIRLIGRAKSERSNEWWIAKAEPHGTNGLNLQHSLTEWQKFWLRGPRFKLFGKEYHIEFLIPAYSLHVKAWQIYVMPASRKKEKLKKILLKRCGKSNLMLRLLFGDVRKVRSLGMAGIENPNGVTQEEINAYPNMTGYRPGVYLYETLRTIRELTPEEAEFNAYEKDLIKKLYDERRIIK